MAIADVDDLIGYVNNLIGSVEANLSVPQKEQAIGQALSELGMSLPNEDDFQCHWIIERSRRHILYVIAIDYARKFQYKQIRLNQRFEHYFKIIEKMDVEFSDAVDVNPNLFPAAGAPGSWLTTYLPTDFVYDQAGKDLTYE